MRLKQYDDPPPRSLRGFQRRLNFRRMMAVIINNQNITDFAFDLKTPFCAAKRSPHFGV